VAAFVLFAAAAGALGVSPNLAAASCRRCASVRVVNRFHGAFIAGGPPGAASPRWLLIQGHVEHGVGNVMLDAGHQVLEHLVAFRAVHHQRVALTVSLKTDARPQVFQGR